jgi:hypothetical protein
MIISTMHDDVKEERTRKKKEEEERWHTKRKKKKTNPKLKGVATTNRHNDTRMDVCMYVCIRVHARVCMCVHMCVCMRMYVCACVNVYVCRRLFASVSIDSTNWNSMNTHDSYHEKKMVLNDCERMMNDKLGNMLQSSTCLAGAQKVQLGECTTKWVSFPLMLLCSFDVALFLWCCFVPLMWPRFFTVCHTPE